MSEYPRTDRNVANFHMGIQQTISQHHLKWGYCNGAELGGCSSLKVAVCRHGVADDGTQNSWFKIVQIDSRHLPTGSVLCLLRLFRVLSRVHCNGYGEELLMFWQSQRFS